MKNLLPFRHPILVVALATAALVCIAVYLFVGETVDRETEPDRTTGPAPLFKRLGDYTKKVSTRNPLAQDYFDQGMMFIWGFNHIEAIRSFEAAATIDPNLAIAWWGVSFAHGPNINALMEDDAVPPALVALEKARALASNASSWERDFIDALATRYSTSPGSSQEQLNANYARAMAEVAGTHPNDRDAAVLHVDAVMNTMAWDYWLPDRTTPKPETQNILNILDRVLKADPDHPGANHALIHLVEAGPDPARGLRSAERLKFYAPDAGHLVHMPSHIFMRTGFYQEAVLANERAAQSDRNYIAACQAQGFYPGMYYPHNEHFLWWAFTFQGRRDEAFAKAREIVRLANSPMCGTPIAEKPRFTHLNLLTAVRFGDWDAISEEGEPPVEEPLDRVMWHWARATMFAAQLDADAAMREAGAARELAGGGAIAAMDNPYLPAIQIAQIAANLAEGRALTARRETDRAIEAFRAAVAIEDSMPYMEPAFWFYPTRQTLGAALVSTGQPAKAAEVFREDLRIWPENGWSLHGLALALEKLGETAEAGVVRARFRGAWGHADVQPGLAMY